LLAASGVEVIDPTGQFLLSLTQHVPYVSYGGTMTGSLAPAIHITGATARLNNLVLSFPGSYLGGIIPNVSFK
jgi:hypothetical protein